MKSRRSFWVSLGILLLGAAPVTTSPLPAQVTTPEAYLGFKPGADFHLMTYEEALGYFETLASETDRMVVLDMGETTAGRRMKYGVISAPENLRQLDRYKEINRRISLPHDLREEEARELAEEGKTIVWIDGGLHGTEVAPAQLLPQLAYDLVAGTDEATRIIRENVITLLVFANPDGMTIVSDWYMGNVGTPYETSPIPWLYHEYVGHDNNRDSFMGNLVETRNMNRAHSREWFPEILYNQHQTGPFPARIWTPPDAEPTNPNVHPLIVRWKSHIGTAMGKAFDRNDQPGAISRVRYDTWYPGYATQVVDGHNVVSILTETQLYRYATPQHFTVSDFPPEHRELTRGVFYPNPWLGGWWRLGDAVAYNHTACMAILEVAARYRRDLLLDKYKVGIDVLERFKGEPPYGYIVPVDQQDPASTRLLLERMLVNGIEVHAADEAFSHNGISYPAGT
ncbi:MAG: M14 family metallopeptidase, partial [Longimicrobiales bacterium]